MSMSELDSSSEPTPIRAAAPVKSDIDVFRDKMRKDALAYLNSARETHQQADAAEQMATRLRTEALITEGKCRALLDTLGESVESLTQAAARGTPTV